MKILELYGSAFEIGEQHGKGAKEEIEFSIQSYKKLFELETKITWAKAKKLALNHLKSIKELDNELIEEIRGISEGAGVDFLDILVLNTRSEIALVTNYHDGCTSLSLLPPKSDNVYLAQNWDWRPSQSNSLILLKINQRNKPNIVMVTEAGIIGKIGMNDNGLGVCLNAIRAKTSSNGIPVHVALRSILNSNNIENAKNLMLNNQFGSSANYLMAQGNLYKYFYNLESSPNVNRILKQDSNYITHTNHFCNNIIRKEIDEENLMEKEDSYVRKERIDTLIKNEEEMIDLNTVKTFLSDHYNGSQTICKHRNPNINVYLDTTTVFSVFMNLTDNKIVVMEGNTCKPTEKYEFDLNN